MYPVDLHMHTVASTHAYSTLSDYIAQAKQKGIKLFAITDHGPDMEDAPHHWHFINMRIWPRVVDGVGILRGIEANIKNVDGEIDCSGKMFESLDLIIAGFHEPVFPPQDKDTNTAAMIATIASGNVHIISHPGNPKYPVDITAIAQAAAGPGSRHRSLAIIAGSRPGASSSATSSRFVIRAATALRRFVALSQSRRRRPGGAAVRPFGSGRSRHTAFMPMRLRMRRHFWMCCRRS